MRQSVEDFELVVQDGASTDGTLETLRRYSDHRIKLISEPDGGPEQGFFRGLERCQGKYLGICQSDEELAPGALAWARRHFDENPKLGAIYGDAELTDYYGNGLGLYRPEGPFTFERFVCGEIRPIWSSSFFRLDAVQQSEVRESSIPSDTEMFMRVGSRYAVEYFEGVVSRYGIHPSAFSSNESMIMGQIEARLDGISRIFHETSEGRPRAHLERRAKASWLLWYAECLLCVEAAEEAIELLRRSLRYVQDDGPETVFLARAKFLSAHVYGDRSSERTPAHLVSLTWERICHEIRIDETEKAKKLIRFLQDSRPLSLDPWVELDRSVCVANGLPARRYDCSKYPDPLNLTTLWLRRKLYARSCISDPFRDALVRDIYIYGGGQLGRSLFHDFRNAGIPIQGIIDQKAEEIQQPWHPIPVHSPDSITTQLQSTAAFVIALYQPEQEMAALQRLEAQGVEARQVTSWKELVYDSSESK